MFVLPPSMDALKQRLRARAADDEATIERRFAQRQARDRALRPVRLRDRQRRPRAGQAAAARASCSPSSRGAGAWRRAAEELLRRSAWRRERRAVSRCECAAWRRARLRARGLHAARAPAQLESAGRPLDASQPTAARGRPRRRRRRRHHRRIAAGSAFPTADLVEVVIQPGAGGDAQIATLGGLRVIRHGRPVRTPFTIARRRTARAAPAAGHAPRRWAAIRSRCSSPRAARPQRVPVQAVELRCSTRDNRPLERRARRARRSRIA